MSNVLLYGGLSVLPLVLGAYLGSFFNLHKNIIGFISAFGAGAMIAALAFGLMEESFLSGGFDQAIIGFIVGGLIFVIGDLLIIKIGGRGHKKHYKTDSTTGWGIVLGAILDGIPESIALGISLLINPNLGLMVLVGIILNNFPEAVSSAYDLKRIGKSFKPVILTWLFVAITAFIFVILGYTLFSQASGNLMALFESLAAGAILAMLASTMMPEAYKESGPSSAMATVFGFVVIFVLSKMGF